MCALPLVRTAFSQDCRLAASWNIIRGFIMMIIMLDRSLMLKTVFTLSKCTCSLLDFL